MLTILIGILRERELGDQSSFGKKIVESEAKDVGMTWAEQKGAAQNQVCWQGGVVALWSSTVITVQYFLQRLKNMKKG